MALSKITADSIAANAVTANLISNTAITTALGFTPANKAGDTLTGTLVAPAINIKAAGSARALITTTASGLQNDDDIGGINWRLNSGAGTVMANIYYKGDSNATSTGSGKLILGARANDGSTTTMDHLWIDAAGRVRMPSQPCFSAYHSVTIKPSGGVDAVKPFDSTKLNDGNCFNTTTYAFTAPIAGVYQFMWGGTIQYSNSADGYATSYLRKNGNATDTARIRDSLNTFGNYYAGPMGCEIHKLAAGDYIQVYYYSQNGGVTWHSNEFVFMGTLIS